MLSTRRDGEVIETFCVERRVMLGMVSPDCSLDMSVLSVTLLFNALCWDYNVIGIDMMCSAETTV